MNFLQAATGNYKCGRTSTIKYIVLHFTANNGDTALGNCKYFRNNKNLQASAHYFVDENEIWQAVKDGDTAFHCGGKSYKHKECRNSNSIGIEMCSRKDGNGRYYIKEETVQRAVALVKELMAKYNIPASRVVRHYDVTGKSCPEPFVRQPVQWERFKSLLTKQEVQEVKKQIKIKLNGKEKHVNAIESGGYNYVKLQDLRDDKIEIGYDGMPIVKVK